LFDAVSATLGICTQATYEGQPAIELEAAADPDEAGAYGLERKTDAASKLVRREPPPVGFELGPPTATDCRDSECADALLLDPARVLLAVLDDRDAGVPIPTIAARFHNTIVAALLEWAAVARERTGLRDVCLSGGCFQNALLLERSVQGLADAGFRVHRHRLVPPNDGCVALGQLVVAAAMRRGCGDRT
jgi:hydrogenase maturation protein HypF